MSTEAQTDLYEVLRTEEAAFGITQANVQNVIRQLRAGERPDVPRKVEVTARAALLLGDELLPRIDTWMQNTADVHGLGTMTLEGNARPLFRDELDDARSRLDTPQSVSAFIRDHLQQAMNWQTIQWCMEHHYGLVDSALSANYARLRSLLMTDTCWRAYVDDEPPEARDFLLMTLFFNGGFNTALNYYCNPMGVAPEVFQRSTERAATANDGRAMFRGVRPLGKRLALSHIALHTERSAILSTHHHEKNFRPEMLRWDDIRKEWGFTPEAARALVERMNNERQKIALIVAMKGTTMEGIRTNCVGLHTSAFEDFERWLTPSMEDLYMPLLASDEEKTVAL